MAIETKISFLYLVTAVLLLCEITFPQVSAAKYYYGRPASAYRLRRKGCKDESKGHVTCAKLIKELGYKVCYTKIVQMKAKLERSCGATCKFCGPPPKSCRRSKYGCCWDAYTISGDIYGITGCPECKDHLKLCPRFSKFCNQDSENGAFMELHCPLTCGKCNERRRLGLKGQRIKMTDWSKL